MAAKDDDREALEGAKVVIGETLTEFRKSCSTMDYRRFIALVRHIGVILIRTLGGHKISFIKTGDVYANVARQTDVGQHLLCLLGFVDTTDGERCTAIEDLRSSKHSLKAFAELTVNAIVIHQRDPLAAKPLPFNASIAFASLYLFYHINFELLGLTAGNDSYNRYMMPSWGSRILFSFQAVEAATEKLAIMQPDSQSHSQWENLKEKILEYVYSEGKSSADKDLGDLITKFAEMMMTEVTPIIPSSSLMLIIKYLVSLMAVLYALGKGMGMDADLLVIHRELLFNLERKCFSGEFVEKLDESSAILVDFDDDFASKVHADCVWKAERVLSHFRPAFFSHLQPRMLQGGPQPQLEGRQNRLRGILDRLKKEGGAFLYLHYMRAVYMFIAEIVNRDEASVRNLSAAIKGNHHVATLALKSNLAISLIYLLGYEDAPPAIVAINPGAMVIRNHQQSKPLMQYFLHIAEGDVQVAKGDICCRRPISTISDRNSIIAYLGYHLRLRIFFLVLYTPVPFFHIMKRDMVNSISAVEALSVKLDILKSGSRLRRCWATVRQQIHKYMDTSDRHNERELLVESLEDLIDNFLQELPGSPVYPLLSFFQNLSALIGYVSVGNMFDSAQSEQYLLNGDGVKVRPDAFTAEFMGLHREALAIVDCGRRRSLTDDERNRIFEVCSWQVENVLSHFRPDGFNLMGGLGDSLSSRSDMMATLLRMMQDNEGSSGGEGGGTGGEERRLLEALREGRASGSSSSDDESDGDEKKDDGEKEFDGEKADEDEEKDYSENEKESNEKEKADDSEKEDESEVDETGQTSLEIYEGVNEKEKEKENESEKDAESTDEDATLKIDENGETFQTSFDEEKEERRDDSDDSEKEDESEATDASFQDGKSHYDEEIAKDDREKEKDYSNDEKEAESVGDNSPSKESDQGAGASRDEDIFRKDFKETKDDGEKEAESPDRDASRRANTWEGTDFEEKETESDCEELLLEKSGDAQDVYEEDATVDGKKSDSEKETVSQEEESGLKLGLNVEARPIEGEAESQDEDASSHSKSLQTSPERNRKDDRGEVGESEVQDSLCKSGQDASETHLDSIDEDNLEIAVEMKENSCEKDAESQDADTVLERNLDDETEQERGDDSEKETQSDDDDFSSKSDIEKRSHVVSFGESIQQTESNDKTESQKDDLLQVTAHSPTGSLDESLPGTDEMEKEGVDGKGNGCQFRITSSKSSEDGKSLVASPEENITVEEMQMSVKGESELSVDSSVDEQKQGSAIFDHHPFSSSTDFQGKEASGQLDSSDQQIDRLGDKEKKLIVPLSGSVELDGMMVSLESCASTVAEVQALLRRVLSAISAKENELEELQEEKNTLERASEDAEAQIVKIALAEGIKAKQVELSVVHDGLGKLAEVRVQLKAILTKAVPREPRMDLERFGDAQTFSLLKMILEGNDFATDVDALAQMLREVIKEGFDQVERIENAMGVKLNVV